MTILFFPRLHAELVFQEPPRGVKFFNPGLKEAGADRDTWRPDNLPLPEAEARRYIRESLGFGEQFSSPADLAFFAGGGLEDFYSQTSAAIRSEFSGKMAAADGAAQPNTRELFLTGQMMLLLAWTLEEKNLELKNLGDRTRNLGRQFRTNLGLDDEERRDPMGLQNALNGLENDFLAWSRLLPWFLLWMTDADCLFVQDRAILDEWQEAGLAFSPLEKAKMPGLGFDSEEISGLSLQKTEASGLQLALTPAGKKDRPWLEKKYSVICMHDEGEWER